MWRQTCLIEEKSLLWDGEDIWTEQNLKDFKKYFTDNPDESQRGFEEKLQQQLAPAALSVWMANCCFADISLGFPFLLRFCGEQSGHSVYPFRCYPGPLARSWRRPFHSCGVPFGENSTRYFCLLKAL